MSQITIDQTDLSTQVFGELREAEVNLPAVISQEIPVDAKADKDKVKAYMAEIDMEDSNSIILFGSKAQAEMTAMSDIILEDVRAKDVGAVGGSLTNMVMKLKELDVTGLDPSGKKGFFARLFGLSSPVEKYLRSYQTVRGQIDEISDNLEGHKDTLLEDIEKLDKLYASNLDYFHELELYIDAGEAKLKELDDKTIPAMAKKVDASSEVIEANKLRDLRSSRDDLERRIHDLKLTRQVTMQSLPSIRMVQQNDKALVNKIGSTVVNTVPLWKNQMAQAVAIYHSQEAGQALEAAQDFTNELLKKNAENLQTSNSQIRKQIERGVFDIDTVKEANDRLIATINESMQIADEAKQKRRDAEVILQQAEAELKKTLASAAAIPVAAAADATA